MWYIIRTPPWYVDRDVSIRNSLRSNYTIRVLVVRTPVSDTYVEVSVGVQALFLPIRRRLKKEKEKSVVYKSTWYDLVRHMQAPNRLGDVGEARWPLSHRWTDTSPTLPDATYDSRNQGRVVSHSELSLLSACVRLCQLREVHHSLQQSLNPWSRTQATDGSPACCT